MESVIKQPLSSPARFHDFIIHYDVRSESRGKMKNYLKQKCFYTRIYFHKKLFPYKNCFHIKTVSAQSLFPHKKGCLFPDSPFRFNI